MRLRRRALLAVTMLAGYVSGAGSVVRARSPEGTGRLAPRPETASGDAPAADEAASFARHVSPLLEYCQECHTGKKPKGDLRLELAGVAEARAAAVADPGLWGRVWEELSSGRMPPVFADATPSDEERARAVGWIEENLLAAAGEPGRFALRRLNNRQYANTLRDLLYLPGDYDAAEGFPPDERGDGFDNNAATLTISPLLIERHLLAVERATVAALNLDPKAAPRREDVTLASKSRLNAPGEGVEIDFANRQEKIRLNLETFAPRAFRRPVAAEEIDELMRFAALSFTHAGESYDQATALAIRATLMSPEFIFRLERDPHPDGTGKEFQITEYQLATRLSYFLWNTMPDDELYAAARDGILRASLEEQIDRMLQDPRAASLTEDFLGQWLEIRGMHEVTNASPSLLEAMRGETEAFFGHIVRGDRSVMELLDADYTFVNEELARLYGIPGVTGEKLRKVAVDGARRGGLVTQASFLTLTAKPLGSSRRTSPVLRGKWILENLFAERIPPPPPDVPELDFDPNRHLQGTVRQILEQHRVDPSCAVCHDRMDPYGFALENYDGYGGWRARDNGSVIDSSGEIGGERFETPVEFRALLAGRQDDFRRALVGKVLSYALGRGVADADRPVIAAICEAVEADGDRFSSIVEHVVRSHPFQHARGMRGRTADDAPGADTVWFHPVPVPAPVSRADESEAGDASRAATAGDGDPGEALAAGVRGRR